MNFSRKTSAKVQVLIIRKVDKKYKKFENAKVEILKEGKKTSMKAII